jgi:translation initiation factor IF-3
MDYSKFCYDQKKREKEAKKNQKVVEIKEIRMSPSIDTNDFNTKAKNAMKFLKDGDKVKVSIRFRGRQISHSEIGLEVMKDFAERLQDIAVVERRPLTEGRNMTMVLAPKESK